MTKTVNKLQTDFYTYSLDIQCFRTIKPRPGGHIKFLVGADRWNYTLFHCTTFSIMITNRIIIFLCINTYLVLYRKQTSDLALFKSDIKLQTKSIKQYLKVCGGKMQKLSNFEGMQVKDFHFCDLFKCGNTNIIPLPISRDNYFQIQRTTCLYIIQDIML